MTVDDSERRAQRAVHPGVAQARGPVMQWGTRRETRSGCTADRRSERGGDASPLRPGVWQVATGG